MILAICLLTAAIGVIYCFTPDDFFYDEISDDLDVEEDNHDGDYYSDKT